jgi:hypothetical protein
MMATHQDRSSGMYDADWKDTKVVLDSGHQRTGHVVARQRRTAVQVPLGRRD